MVELHSSLKITLERLSKILNDVHDPEKDNWDPVELGLLVAKLEYSELDIELEQKKFETLGMQVASEVAEIGRTRERTLALIRSFSQSLGFQGDTSNYYNPKNSFINDVYLRRKGIPLSLCIVFMGLARYVGLKTVGIAFPGHFLVKVLPICEDEPPAETANLFVDPFEGGRILSIDDCKKRLEEWTRGLLPFSPDVLRVAHPRDMVSRMLRNLRAIYNEKEDLPRLYWVLSALIELCPQEKNEALRERGFLMARMGRYHQAVDDLKEFMRLSNDASKYEHVERILRFFELQKEQTN
ncbi:tetratricopeptide repeat protein [bacterium]|nr:tetratricopeptide repeat protein [bacterium]